MKRQIAIAFAAIVMLSASGGAARHTHSSKYARQEGREIKSLSAEDIAELRRGGGWGFARAAELNGLPGPAHLLEMRDEISLSEDQANAVAVIQKDMKSRATAEGKKLIALERRLDRHFRGGTVTDDVLRSMLSQIAAARRALRYIHLSTHLKTPAILSATQIEMYNTLRGYSH